MIQNTEQQAARKLRSCRLPVPPSPPAELPPALVLENKSLASEAAELDAVDDVDEDESNSPRLPPRRELLFDDLV